MNTEKHKKHRKAKLLLQLLADRHLAAGSQKEFKSLASAIDGNGSNSRRIFGRRKRTTSGHGSIEFATTRRQNRDSKM